MASVILAGTTSTTALNLTGDTSGELQLKTNNGSTTALTLTTGGNINIPTAGARITGDFSNATVANRVAFQTSTTNGNTALIAIPNGTATTSAFALFGGNDPANAQFTQLLCVGGSDSRIVSSYNGTPTSGTYLPLTMYTGGSERLRIDTSGNVGIGTSSPTRPLHVFTTGFGVANFIASGGETNVVIQNTGTNGRNWSLIAGGNGGAFSSGQFGIYDNTAAAARLAIDSSGNVGIGTSSPTNKFTTVSTDNVNIVRFAGATYGLTFASFTTGGGFRIEATDPTGVGSYQPLITSGSIQTFLTNNTERMRINSSGDLCVNMTTSNGATLNITGYNNTYGTAEFVPNSSKGSNNSHIHYGTTGDWYIRPANNSGKVYVLNYQAESDERLKKDIAPITYGLAEIQQLQPRQFRWKEGDDSEVNGFIAQEVEAVIPTLVSEGQWKSVDYQGITAILVKAIQEQQAIITDLKQRIETLEAK